MIRLSKLTDYSIVILAELSAAGQPLRTASEIASVVSIPEPTVSKVLKIMAKAEILTSSRGVKGGYALARPANMIFVSEVIEAVEGPIALTACVSGSDTVCAMENLCSLNGRWGAVNRAVRGALESVTLQDMVPQRRLPKEVVA